MAVNGLLIPSSENWMPVPLKFPYDEWTNTTDWAQQMAQGVIGADDREAVAAAFAELQTASPPLEGAQARFLWTIDVQQPLLLHVYVAEITGDMPPLHELATAGIGGFIQNLQAVDAEEYSRALLAIVVLGAEDEDGITAVAMRWIGEQHDALVIVDVLTEQAGVLALAMDDAEALFRSIRVQGD